MKTAIMQPYLLPYIGYFQLIGAVDVFVVYDNIKYTKQGWINRNRFLRNGEDVLFSVPLQRDSDSLDVRDRAIASDFDRDKLLTQLREAYRRAPQFTDAFPLVERVVRHSERNLFSFIYRSIIDVCVYLGIATPIAVSSEIPIDHTLKGQAKVIAICRSVGANTYINAIGGTTLYSKEEFAANGIELRFLKPRPFAYEQLGAPFVPWLSILDVIMFNPKQRIMECVAGNYDLI